MRRLLSHAAVLACAGVAAVTFAAPAQAHTELVSAAPGPGDEVAPGVATIALTFGPLSGTGERRITVTGPDDTAVAVGEAVVVNAKTLCATVDPLTTGVHALAYEATSADGHAINGKFYFEVVEGGTDSADPGDCARAVLPAPDAAAPAGPPDRGVGQVQAVLIGVAAGGSGLLVMLLAGWLLRRRAERRPAG
ncbi:copper resistance protein CopC [Solwaraspora sp. WMMA2080]|uniref:copper resistance CopC family protein n=1 Tax=unclassified Solwaraspora TaxID=2627926 RepID=UPI00248C34DD|nr:MULTISPECIES: copper resistance CopC family protein [unclassified Solwaraspora]WBB99821.1 copper resistance protein CopC [Solwaraspora sp. WMMA2059]WBC21631.1 copper resistance protein CopC [Solwaraspora sp. WMMA2080]